MNRTLLSLNLGSNLIEDAGCSKLAEVSYYTMQNTPFLRLPISPKRNSRITSKYYSCHPIYITRNLFCMDEVFSLCGTFYRLLSNSGTPFTAFQSQAVDIKFQRQKWQGVEFH